MPLFRMLPGNRSAELLIYDNIGDNFFGPGLTAHAVMTELRDLDIDEISVRINSPGGNVSDGNAIYNALVRHPARVVVDIDGFALSAASVVAMSGDEIRMAQNAMLMMHEAQGFTSGDAMQHERTAKTLRALTEAAANVYAARSGAEQKKVLKWMADTTWFTADDAVSSGLATSVTAAKEPPTNCWDPRSLQMLGKPPAGVEDRLAQMVRSERQRVLPPSMSTADLLRLAGAPPPAPPAPAAPPPRPVGIGRLAHERHRRLGDV